MAIAFNRKSAARRLPISHPRIERVRCSSIGSSVPGKAAIPDMVPNRRYPRRGPGSPIRAVEIKEAEGTAEHKNDRMAAVS
jgi:hypothetical protein